MVLDAASWVDRVLEKAVNAQIGVSPRLQGRAVANAGLSLDAG